MVLGATNGNLLGLSCTTMYAYCVKLTDCHTVATNPPADVGPLSSAIDDSDHPLNWDENALHLYSSR